MRTVFKIDLLARAFFSIFAFVIFLIPSSLYGAGLTIQPVKISHTLNPGESVSGSISLSNAGDGAVNVSLKIEDFEPTAGGEGIQFVGRAQGVTTVRDWISFDSSKTFVFQQGEQASIPYTITAPIDAEPGSHFGVLLFKASDIKESGTLKIGTQVGVLVFVTVTGDYKQEGKILGMSAPRFVQKGPVPVTIKFENTGTVHFEPKGTLKVTNIFGKEVAQVPISGQVVLPTGVRDILVSWEPEGFILGRYIVSPEIMDDAGNIIFKDSVSVWAFPVWYLLSYLGLALVIFFGIKFILKKVHFSVSLK